MAGVITASQPPWIGPFTGLSPRCFGKLVTAVALGRPLPGNRNDCKAWELSGAKVVVGDTTVIADGGYRGTGLV